MAAPASSFREPRAALVWMWRRLRRGPALTLVTIVALGAGLVLFFELGGPSAEIVDRVGIVDAWTITPADEGAAALRPIERRDAAALDAYHAAVVGPEGHVVEAYWLGRPCDSASRVTISGRADALVLRVEPRNPRPLGGCDDAGVLYRLTLVANRPLARGSVTAEVARDP